MFTRAGFVMALLVAAVSASDASAQIPKPEPMLNDTQMETLKGPAYTREPVDCGGLKLVVVTRDYGVGRSMRDAFVFRRSPGGWSLLAFVDSRSTRIDARCENRSLELRDAAGRTLVAVPTGVVREAFASDLRPPRK